LKNKIFIFLLLIASASSIFAQNKTVQNQLQSDNKRIHFGFTLGADFMNLGVRQSNAIAPDGNIYSMSVNNYSPGFTVGVISDLRLCEYLNLRFVPVVHFGDIKTTFIDQNQNLAKEYTLKTTIVDFPIYLKYRAKRINNYRPYVLLGGGFDYQVGRQKGEVLLLKPADINIQFGVGCDFYLPYFKFAPELKFCIGMLDVLDKERKDLVIEADRKYTDALLRLTNRLLVLTFNFE